ncbi:MAG: 30S ribosomal protein S13 [Alphaproteobacteria bacterium RIFCSPLOWO2_01_FULL_40_26]|nr:MAG: 30S ribosomal protein S13 [Alphaproteobacteria bacterium RIFCSPHIGHO2_02_FULL_40_34]OFW86345.1 MAG: 30S ribosomal protein S13 [Alphaproteobacteria bacterium RIFCSPHIGHO2_01_FULL_40_8]OFW95106.1 MAG: 30S ribosomal protein S13 [Alphaproteobacteria bacterium RIFCSPLOWO2_01_FULL_40_26]OFX09071.1 MAG: 30S ribosomal protein S13 [Alphaproteobacteria bacterium RIFCSPLOWO2_02_FULL_40_19]OFX10708.1 MAG: 30S ribosomal protein S13 [Alphaproteobacteria bacterium RIFCSPLOWO2_12_FULL_40_11]
MARIAGVNIPKEKRFVIALTYIYGIGTTTANKICKKLKINLGLRTHQVNEDKLAEVRTLIEKEHSLLEGDLRRKVSSDIKRLIDIGCYRGIRHVKKLPLRGQRTHTNAKTRKGRGVAIANKKKAVK